MDKVFDTVIHINIDVEAVANVWTNPLPLSFRNRFMKPVLRPIMSSDSVKLLASLLLLVIKSPWEVSFVAVSDS